MLRPHIRPKNPCFSSGPCSKHPEWNLSELSGALVGRSHRSQTCIERIQEVLDRSRKTLAIPDDYFLGIVPGSDTGAMEMAMWSLLGERPVDVLYWENFGQDWMIDIVEQLRIPGVRVFQADYGSLPHLHDVNSHHDIVFTWNGTTSGVCVADGDWIATDRTGLTICDATSAIFSMPLPWSKLDVVTYSWQKSLGGEAAHGVLILSPRAVERLETFQPDRAIPKLFRLTKKGKLNKEIFQGVTINTISMLCIEDVLSSLRWIERMGGIEFLWTRCRQSLSTVEVWQKKTPWVEFMAHDPRTRSCTSICLRIVDPRMSALSLEDQRGVINKITALLAQEGVAYDVNGHKAAPPCLRLWTGITVETEDVVAVLPWLEWAFEKVME